MTESGSITPPPPAGGGAMLPDSVICLGSLNQRQSSIRSALALPR